MVTLLCLSGALAGAADSAAELGAAARYLDARAAWWSAWPSAARDHDTFCISCHTALPYALSRPALRRAMGGGAPGTAEVALLENAGKRVRLWQETKPYYFSNAKAPERSAESRATEAVLNVLVLEQGGELRDLTAAVENMWAAQSLSGPRAGGFPWLDFHNRPWEADDSAYYGSALAAVSVSRLPESLRRPERERNLAGYLRGAYAQQSPANRLIALWAANGWPGLLSAPQRQQTIQELIRRERADGGWSLTDLAGEWKRADGTPLAQASDGYATGLVVYVLRSAGVLFTDDAMVRGMEWLRTNQSATDGHWPGYSLNKQRDPESDAGRFMNDAATAYAVLALTAREER